MFAPSFTKPPPVPATVISATNATLTDVSATALNYNFTADGLSLALPPASSYWPGGMVMFTATGYDYALRDASGNALAMVTAAQPIALMVLANSANGGPASRSWKVMRFESDVGATGVSTVVEAANGAGYMSMTALSATTAIVTYRWGSNSYARVLDISGSTITVGAAATVIASGVTHSVRMLTSTTAICIYASGGANVYAVVLSVSGSTITVGTPSAALTGASSADYRHIGVCVLSPTLVVAAYDSGGVSAHAMTISGTTITAVGTAVTTGGLGTIGEIDVVDLSATSFVWVCFTTGGVYARAGTVSGTSITLGTQETLAFPYLTSNSYYNQISLAKLSSTKVIFYANRGYSTPPATQAAATVLDISGTTITATNKPIGLAEVATANYGHGVVVPLTSTTALAVTYTSDGVLQQLLKVNGSALSVVGQRIAKSDAFNVSSIRGISAAALFATKVVFAWTPPYQANAGRTYAAVTDITTGV